MSRVTDLKRAGLSRTGIAATLGITEQQVLAAELDPSAPLPAAEASGPPAFVHAAPYADSVFTAPALGASASWTSDPITPEDDIGQLTAVAAPSAGNATLSVEVELAPGVWYQAGNTATVQTTTMSSASANAVSSTARFRIKLVTAGGQSFAGGKVWARQRRRDRLDGDDELVTIPAIVAGDSWTSPVFDTASYPQIGHLIANPVTAAGTTRRLEVSPNGTDWFTDTSQAMANKATASAMFGNMQPGGRYVRFVIATTTNPHEGGHLAVRRK